MLAYLFVGFFGVLLVGVAFGFTGVLELVQASYLLLLVSALGLLVTGFALWLLCLIEALKIPDPTWQAVGQSKTLFALLMVFLGVLGSLLYMAIPRPALKAADDTE